MSNMSYCRFINTLEDLRGCYENMEETKISEEELKARKRLISLCCDIAEDFGEEIGRDFE